MVPASTLTSLGISTSGLKKSATATDGVSDTPLVGATVQACDPVTEKPISGIPTATTDSNGSYTLDLSKATSTVPSDILVKATKTSGDKVVSCQCLGSSTEAANINAASTMAWNKVKDESSQKAGNLPGNATDIPSTNKQDVQSLARTLFDNAKNLIGNIDTANVPTLVYTITGKTTPEVEKEMFETMSGGIGREISGSTNTTLKNEFASYVSSFATKVGSMVVNATYPSGLEMPTRIQWIYYPNWFPFSVRH